MANPLASVCVPRHANNLPPESIQRCLAQVEIALSRGNPDQAHAAITAVYFRPGGHVDERSPLAQTELPVRLVNMLEREGILTVAHLCDRTRLELLTIRHLSERGVQIIESTLKDLGFGLRRP